MPVAAIIFPHHLFKENPALDNCDTVYLVEETLFFNQYAFHKQKLVLHRASMKWYEHFLKKNNVAVTYIEAGNRLADIRKLISHLSEQGIDTVHVCEPADDWLNRRLQKACTGNNLTLHKYPGPGFLNSTEEGALLFRGKKTYFQTAFYIQQRKQRKLLLTKKGEPEGGQWTFDKENRKRLPKGKVAPVLNFAAENEYTAEAIQYVEKQFPDNYGSSSPFFYPVTFDAASGWLDDFLQNRFRDFGVYEDAVIAAEQFLHHSVLTPALNTGLITPQQVLDRTLAFAAAKNIPLNSTEGFIRQITGWREFIKIVYSLEGSKQRSTNYWGFTKKIPPAFWKANTGIEPVDKTIEKVLQTGYCHHIERLMILGNFMLLCEFDPDEVYKWFMEMFIDAYDWVMVPNVYGMTQFADGGLMTTKPYISGSNYLLKMSDYKKGLWCEIWDALFWRFMHVHRNFFLQNPRLGMLLKTFDNMPAEKKAAHLHRAEKFLQQL